MTRLLTLLSVVAVTALVGAAPTVAKTPSKPEVSISATPTEVAIGEPFHIFIDITHPPGASINLPATISFGETFGERERASVSTRNPDGTMTTRVELAVLAFAVGDVVVPPIPLTYVEDGRIYELSTELLPISVKSVIGDGEPSLREIAPPVSVEVTNWLLVLAVAAAAGLLVVILVAVIVARLLRRRRGTGGARGAEREEPLLDPEEEAHGRLEALEASGAFDRADLKPAYHEMSEILRNYLGRRYSFPALDLTTQEIEEKLHEIGVPVGTLGIGEWLRASDLVKFAGYSVGSDEARAAAVGAHEFVEALRPRPEQPGSPEIDAPKEASSG